MSSTTINKTTIPQSISQRLKQLRSAISRFLLVDGLSKVLVATLLLVLVDVLLDRVFKMDLAQRGIMLCVIIAVILIVAFLKLFKPFSKRITDDALILQVEGKNKELKESVISAAQFSRGSNYEKQGYSQSMIDATIQQGSQMAEKIQFGSALDSTAFIRNMILLLASVIGLGAIGYGVLKTDFWRTWFDRNVMLTNAQWPRDTVLAIEGVNDGQMTLLRGEDHKQIVRIDPESKKQDVDVTIEFDTGNVRTTQKMRKTGELEHTLVFRNLSSEFRFRAVGGDDTTDWVQVDLVDAPNWSDITMKVEMPEYTGIGSYELPPGGGPHSILSGSTLTMQGKANKPLTKADLKVGEQTWNMNNEGGDVWSLSLASEDMVGGKYTFDLADASGLRSSRPTTFALKVKPDRPPSVRATLVGITGLVVPRVRIPMSYTAGDEFKITDMNLEHSWIGQASGSVAQEGSIALTQLDPELEKLIGKNEIKSVAVADMEPLNIPEGTNLRLTITATDNNTLTGPGIGKSREFLLRVVSEGDLRADLLLREIEQRKAFELIIGNQERLTFDLQAIADAAMETDSKLTADQAVERLRDTQRRQKLVGTNVSRIADRFQNFLTEAINNRLNEDQNEISATQTIDERYSENIIKPIRELDGNQIIRAGQLIELSQRTISDDSFDKAVLTTAIGEAIDKQNEVIDEMKKVLASMKKSETYQEVVNKVIEIKKGQERMQTKAREKNEKIGSGDIFDDEVGDDLFDDEEMSDEDSDEKSDNEDDQSSEKKKDG